MEIDKSQIVLLTGIVVGLLKINKTLSKSNMYIKNLPVIALILSGIYAGYEISQVLINTLVYMTILEILTSIPPVKEGFRNELEQPQSDGPPGSDDPMEVVLINRTSGIRESYSEKGEYTADALSSDSRLVIVIQDRRTRRYNFRISSVIIPRGLNLTLVGVSGRRYGPFGHTSGDEQGLTETDIRSFIIT
jgi:hypothetical protein